MDPVKGEVKVIGAAAPYMAAEFSPDGDYLLVGRLVGPWSHEVAWWRFAREIEVWDEQGELLAGIASLPVADEVPIHGVPERPRSISWRPTAPHSLFWVEGSRPSTAVIPWPKSPIATGSCACVRPLPQNRKRSSGPNTGSSPGATPGEPNKER